jgi:hypothetical protein
MQNETNIEIQNTAASASTYTEPKDVDAQSGSLASLGVEVYNQASEGKVATSDSAAVSLKKGKGGFDPLGKIELFRGEELTGLAILVGIHMLFVFVLVRLIYYPIAKRKDFLFTYFMFSISIFMMCFLLESVKVEMGFALGLFAVFGIIRYRTDAIPIKEMTYLFIVIGMSVMNALINKKITLAELFFANSAILALTYGLEKVWLLRHESQKLIVYERIDLIQQGRREELIADLQTRTGIKINRLEIGKIDFLRDTVMLKIYFYEDQQDSQMDESFSSGFNN